MQNTKKEKNIKIIYNHFTSPRDNQLNTYSFF